MYANPDMYDGGTVSNPWSIDAGHPTVPSVAGEGTVPVPIVTCPDSEPSPARTIVRSTASSPPARFSMYPVQWPATLADRAAVAAVQPLWSVAHTPDSQQT